MELLAQVLHPDAVLPRLAHDGDAGYDLVAVEGCTVSASGGRAVVPIGIAVAIPEGFGGFVLPRSGLASRHGVTCINSPGLIDSGFRGEVRVALVNLDPVSDYVVQKGDRVAQLVLVAVASPDFRAVTELPPTGRGDGFGSSGR